MFSLVALMRRPISFYSVAMIAYLFLDINRSLCEDLHRGALNLGIKAVKEANEAEPTSNEDAKRLFDDLLRNYNRLRRPVEKPKDKVIVFLKLRLSQIIDVKWEDKKLSWNPESYGGVDVLYVPSEMIWVPDIVLYNNADSDYHITITTKATVHSNGTVVWDAPAIYKSLCQINVLWFPFDTQTCDLKLGCWTYDYGVLDLVHMDQNESSIVPEEDPKTKLRENISVNYRGIDLEDYYQSVEWEVMATPAKRHVRRYQSCCPDSDRWVDITYYIRLRRKPLFYTVNLILPCVGISFLTILVFYLPSDSGEKVALSISILVSLTVFFLLLTEIIPATSVALPLIGKYLLFTMLMVTLSVIITVVALNLHFRTPTTHRMPRWVKRVFLEILPRYLLMKRPVEEEPKPVVPKPALQIISTGQQPPTSATVSAEPDKVVPVTISRVGSMKRESMKAIMAAKNATKAANAAGLQLLDVPDAKTQHRQRLEALYKSPPVLQAFENVCFIAELLKKQDKDNKIDEDWKYVAMVLDRLFLLIFSLSCLAGTMIIMLKAPALYDTAKPIT